MTTVFLVSAGAAVWVMLAVIVIGCGWGKSSTLTELCAICERRRTCASVESERTSCAWYEKEAA